MRRIDTSIHQLSINHCSDWCAKKPCVRSLTLTHASNKSQLMKGNHVANWQEENPSCRDLRRTVAKVGLPRYRRGSTRFQSRQNCEAGCPYPQSLNWSFHSIQPSYLVMTNIRSYRSHGPQKQLIFPFKHGGFPQLCQFTRGYIPLNHIKSINIPLNHEKPEGQLIKTW